MRRMFHAIVTSDHSPRTAVSPRSRNCLNRPESSLSFRRVRAPNPAALDFLVHPLSARIAWHLERRGLLVRDHENDFLTVDASDDSRLDKLRGHSITYRIALGPDAGRKAFTLQTPRTLAISRAVRRGPITSHCMLGCSPPQTGARNSNACVATSHGLP